MVAAATISAEAPLRVGQMGLADPLAHRHHDALPAHHGAEAQRDGDADLHPERDEARAALQAAGVGLQRRGLRGR